MSVNRLVGRRTATRRLSRLRSMLRMVPVSARRRSPSQRLREIAERSSGRAGQLQPWPWILGRR